jgi:S1-C subfamily serine protease
MQFSFRHVTFAAVFFFVGITAHAKTASEIYELASRITVVVESTYDEKETTAQGSGVILSEEEVVTNCHVIKGASQIEVLIGNEVHSATLRYSDWDRDICSLSVKGLGGGLGGQVAVPSMIGNSKTLKVGTKVYAVSAPHGLELTLSDGIVSSLREVEGGNYIQTTAAISPGSSGGGLFDENGALVGIMSFNYTKGQNLNFASRVEWIEELPKRSVKAVPTPNAKSEIADSSRRTTERESITDVEIVRSDFGLFGAVPTGDPAFQASRSVPLQEDQTYGWFMELKTSKPKIKWREEIVFPSPLAILDIHGSTAQHSTSEDGLTVTTELEEVVPDGGLIYHMWGVAAGDPKGPHVMRIYVEDKLVRTFEFEVEE